jgi:hypothetical protein
MDSVETYAARLNTQGVYSVRDIKADAYLPPMIMRTDGEALRSFESTCKTKDHQFAQFPSDFVMVRIGDWDQYAGRIYPFETPKILGTAAEYVQKN